MRFLCSAPIISHTSSSISAVLYCLALVISAVSAPRMDAAWDAAELAVRELVRAELSGIEVSTVVASLRADELDQACPNIPRRKVKAAWLC